MVRRKRQIFGRKDGGRAYHVVYGLGSDGHDEVAEELDHKDDDEERDHDGGGRMEKVSACAHEGH